MNKISKGKYIYYPPIKNCSFSSTKFNKYYNILCNTYMIDLLDKSIRSRDFNLSSHFSIHLVITQVLLCIVMDHVRSQNHVLFSGLLRLRTHAACLFHPHLSNATMLLAIGKSSYPTQIQCFNILLLQEPQFLAISGGFKIVRIPKWCFEQWN